MITSFEIIIAVLSSSVVTAIITTLANRKTMKIENDKQIECFWKERFEFLEKRIEKLEKLTCYDSDCVRRI